MEEGFNYPAGTSLAANPPWSGSAGSSVSIMSGSLVLTNLRATVPPGNMLIISGGASRTVYRNFDSNGVTNGTLYCSALIRCLQPPTNSQFIAALLPSGSTSHNSDSDPLDLSVTAVTNGNAYSFRLTSGGSDPATWRQGLTTNETHFIVLKYDFSSLGQASLYVDPPPGGPEPSSPDISTGSGSDDGSSAAAANLQVLLLQSPSSAGQGSFNLDAIRVGTNWADVAPAPAPLTLDGPHNQAVCFGSSATFSVIASGTPPYVYQWRINGVAVANATNSTFTLNNPGGTDALNNYDVVVSDAFGSVTSLTAGLTFSTNGAAIAIPPSSQPVLPGASNVTYNVVAAGDPPISYQWRTNGTPVPDATNNSYTLDISALSNSTVAVDVMVSNPCGSVLSTPAVGLYYPNVFNFAYDAGPGFFGGENIIFTNTSGLTLYGWSSPDLSASVTNWTLEGPMSEFPLGVTGKSRYGITVNPGTSPVYYIFSDANTGPFVSVEALAWLTTADYVSFTLTSSNATISANGIFNLNGPSSSTNSFFLATDAGPGTPGGENLSLTNVGGTALYVWSSPDPSIPVSNWTLVGQMTETPIGSAGQSSYTISLNPQTSPEYYIIAGSSTGPYTPAEALNWLVTSNFQNYSVMGSNVSISDLGVFALPALPVIIQPPKSQTVLPGHSSSFSVAATGSGLGYQWLFNNVTIPNATNPVFTLSSVSNVNAGPYAVIVTNAIGSVTSTLATLTVTLPPAMKLVSSGAGIQLSAACPTGVTYVVESSTNISSPVWTPVLTNNTGASGVVTFQAGVSGTGSQYYRLLFP